MNPKFPSRERDDRLIKTVQYLNTDKEEIDRIHALAANLLEVAELEKRPDDDHQTAAMRISVASIYAANAGFLMMGMSPAGARQSVIDTLDSNYVPVFDKVVKERGDK